MLPCQALSLPSSVFVPPARVPGPRSVNDNTQHKLAAASAHRLWRCFSLPSPGYFCREIHGKEKKFLLLFLHFFPCEGSRAGPAPLFCGAQQPGVLRKETQRGHLPLGTAQPPVCGHAGFPSSVPSEGNRLLSMKNARGPPSDMGEGWGDFVGAKGPGCLDLRSLAQPRFKARNI